MNIPSTIDITTSGTIAALNANVPLTLNGQSAATVQVTGTWVGTLQFEGTLDGTTWVTINAVAALTSGPTPITTVNGLYRLTPGGLATFRVNATAYTSGTAVITMRASGGVGGTFINQTAQVANAAAVTTVVTILQNATVATSNGASLVVTGYGTAVLQITGTFVATINFEFSTDSGASWDPISATQIGAGDIFSSTTIPGSFRITCTALDLIRARVTYTSGSVTINGRASNAINASKVVKLATGTNTIGTVNIGLDPDTTNTGTITTTDIVVAAPIGDGVFKTGTSTSGSYVFIPCPGGDSAWNTEIIGLTTGTLYFEGSIDSTNGIDGQWIAVNGRQTGISNTVLNYSTTTNGLFRGNTSGLKYYRIRSVGILTGTPAITIRLSSGIGAVFLNASIPSGTNTIGNINELRASTTTVTATGVSGAAVTLTLPAVVSQFHYITSINILVYATAVRTGSATPLVVTTTNITGSPAFTFETAQSIGTNTPIQGYNLTTPLKSTTVNTDTTIIAPIATSGIWRITVTYFTAT